MPYARPDAEQVKKTLAALTERVEKAKTYGEARAAFLEEDALQRHLYTLGSLVEIRHTVDTRDAFYAGEKKFWDETEPSLMPFTQSFTAALLASPFRGDFEKEFGTTFLLNAEMALKTFSPEIIPDLQEENKLVTAYEALLASSQIPFMGKVYTISQIGVLKSDPDDAVRLGAWQAEGGWYKDHQDELDGLYDKLVHLRDGIAKKLGYESYVPLGYYRMGRTSYGREEVEAFRRAVVKHLVPVADAVYRDKAARLGKTYPMNFADNALTFRSGNPRPRGGREEILKAAEDFYTALSPETAAFWRQMLDGELMDLASTEGKRGGGYCTMIPDYKVPFIFANFNGTDDDVETVTHEAGHAFAFWLNMDRVPLSDVIPGMDGAEIHSMSMEFFAETAADAFFGKDAKKFLYSHLAGALTFIPYGAMVDHFQHVVYDKPSMTPGERHALWRELLGVYMPWVKLGDGIPFYGDGEGWQRQHHIYSLPFYYIDYCLAQTVALSFWKMIREDRRAAWEKYLAYARLGGSLPFTPLLEKAGLAVPFDEATLSGICREAAAALRDFDLTGIV